MNPSNPSQRRRRHVRLSAEALETRNLLTGGAGATFAIVPGEIAAANQPAVVKFTIDPAHFTLPNGKLTVGIDVAANAASTGVLHPAVLGVQGPDGKAVPGVSHALYDRTVQASGKVSSPMTSAVLAPLTLSGKKHDGPATYTVIVSGDKGGTSKFLLGFYLPGDANGDGAVDQKDLTTVKAAMNANVSSAKYSFDADTNRDGRINAKDLAIVRKNMGVKTTVSPSISADLDPADKTGLQDRATTHQTVHFSGNVTPGAKVTYSVVTQSNPPVSTTADTQGHYNLMVPLAEGANTFHVTTLDGFGQSIAGNIPAVSYFKSPAEAAAAAKQTP